MAFAEAASELLLLQIHHAHQVRQVALRALAAEQAELRADAQLGKENPTDSIDLRQRERAAHGGGEHPPQLTLECFRVGVLRHFILTNHAVRFNRLIESGVLELLARDSTEHHAVAPREADLPLMRAFALYELCVTFQSVDDLMRV